MLFLTSLDIFNTFGKIAGFAGLALAVFMVVVRDIIAKRIFPRLTQNQAYIIIMSVLFFVFILSGFIVYKSYKVPAESLETDKSGAPYEYSFSQSSQTVSRIITEVYQQEEKRYVRLNSLFDQALDSKVFIPSLCEDFATLANDGQDEYAKISALSNNKPLNSLVYLQGTIIGGSNLRLALLYEMRHSLPDVLKYAKKAIIAEDTALFHIGQTSAKLSADSKAEFNKWLTNENHINRYRFARFMASGLVYEYDSAGSGIKSADLHNLFTEVESSYIITRQYNDTTAYPVIGWLKNQHIISF